MGLFGSLAKAEVSFEKQVKPVLESACLSCHGRRNPKGASIAPMKGCWKVASTARWWCPENRRTARSTTTILPADADEVMPPKGELLNKDQSNALKEWIAAGAKWPEGVVLKQVRRIDFVKDIKPILETSCLSCHREGNDKGDLRLDERQYAFEPGEYGAAVVPFDLEKSSLYQTVILPADHDDLMPPANKGGPLEQKQIDLLRDWIEQGAAWPEGLKLEPVRRETEGGPASTGTIAAAPKEVIDIRIKAVEQLIKQLEPTMKPYTDEIPGTGVKFEMVPIPGGEFIMGSPQAEKGHNANEGRSTR